MGPGLFHLRSISLFGMAFSAPDIERWEWLRTVFLCRVLLINQLFNMVAGHCWSAGQLFFL